MNYRKIIRSILKFDVILRNKVPLEMCNFLFFYEIEVSREKKIINNFLYKSKKISKFREIKFSLKYDFKKRSIEINVYVED